MSQEVEERPNWRDGIKRFSPVFRQNPRKFSLFEFFRASVTLLKGKARNVFDNDSDNSLILMNLIHCFLVVLREGESLDGTIIQ